MDIAICRARAKVAVDAYMAVNPDYSEDMLINDEVVTDLIADILHLCKAEDIDTAAVLRMAEVNFEGEI